MLNSNTKNNSIKVYSERGKIVGTIENNALVKTLRSSIHMLRKPRGWASDAYVLTEAEKLGANKIIIHDKDTGFDFSAPINDSWLHGVPINRGHGDQICLPLVFWEKSKTNSPEKSQLIFPF